ncbi:acid protease, partial [Cutaneotrichosporon oleaginosum]
MLTILALLTVASGAVVEREPLRIGLSRLPLSLEKRGEPLTSTNYGSTLHMNISVGTPEQNLLVPIVIGDFSDMLVLATPAVGDPNPNAGNRTLFDPSASSTFELGGATVFYGLRSQPSVGTAAQDTVRVGPVSLPKQPMLMANVTDFDQVMNIKRGTLGMAGFSPTSGFGLDLAAAAGGNEIGLFVTPSSSRLGAWSYGLNAGEMSLGGLNRYLYTGNISYCDVVNPENWIVALEGLKVNNISVPVVLDPPPAKAPTVWLAPDFNGIFLRKTLADLVFALIPGSSSVYDAPLEETRWYAPCDTTATVSLVLGGQEYALPAKRWLTGEVFGSSGSCATLFRSYVQSANSSSMLIGLPFASTVYTVLKFGTTPQIGFAPLSPAALAHAPEQAANPGDKPTGAIPSGRSSTASAAPVSTGAGGTPVPSDGTRARALQLSWLIAVALTLHFL